METINNPAPDILSIRADRLTQSITKVNTQLVEICCALQLIDTDEAYFTVTVLNKEGVNQVIEIPYWLSEDRKPVTPLVKEKLLQMHTHLATYRSSLDVELNGINRQLAAMGRTSIIGETPGDL